MAMALEIKRKKKKPVYNTKWPKTRIFSITPPQQRKGKKISIPSGPAAEGEKK